MQETRDASIGPHTSTMRTAFMKIFENSSLPAFLCVGAFATGLQYVLALAFVFCFGFSAAFASTLGYAISAIANYLLNARFTFGHTGTHAQTMPRFMLVTGMGFTLNFVLMTGLAAAGLNIAIAQILTTILVTLWNYAINVLWTFKPARN